ncbi:tetratricopeptide repeat protein [Thiovibrio sp. JS02]
MQEAECLYLQVIALCPEHVDSCVYLGLLYSGLEQFAEAAGCFAQAQALLPNEPAIAYHLGTAYYATGQKRMAIEQFQKTLALDNLHWQAAYNLGTVFLGSGQLPEAIAAYEKAAGLQPGDPDIHFNLGLAYKKAGRLEEAMRAYGRALEIAPDDAEAHYNLALVHKESHRKEDAIASLEIAIALKPDYAQAHGNLGVLYLDQGRVEAAVACYRQLIALNHNVESARHILAALTGVTTVSAPSSYIADLFDSFSARFEDRLLVDLEYRTPWDLKSLLLAESGQKRNYPRLLDLGCGTGLVGQVFADLSSCRVGVDLSPKMIEVAAAKKIYDQLAVAEIVDFLGQHDALYDLIVAADVLIYVGGLESIFPLLAERLAPGGRVLFSTEQLDGDGYVLRQSGRFAHSPAYIREVAERCGLKVLAFEAARIRKEKGEWLLGSLFLLGA